MYLHNDAVKNIHVPQYKGLSLENVLAFDAETGQFTTAKKKVSKTVAIKTVGRSQTPRPCRRPTCSR